MKKLLRIPIIIILFLGVGFLYVVQNPSLAISQKVLTTLGITTPVHIEGSTPTTTGMDLTNCISYFDGCNNCTVENGKPSACTLMYCEIPSEPKCTQYANTGDIATYLCIRYFDGCNTCNSVGLGQPWACTTMYCETPSTAECLEYASDKAGLANPASTHCVNNGGTIELLEGTGGQYGICHLPDGTSCEERAYMRGECGSKQDNIRSKQDNVQGEPGVWPSNLGSKGTACTMEYAPVCASVAVECFTVPCGPGGEQTFSNRCTMNANNNAKFLHEGECTTK